jgi:hypothetical protein
LFTALKKNNSIKSLDIGYSPSARVLGAKENELSHITAGLLMEYLVAQPGLLHLNLGRIDLPMAQRNILIEEMGKRDGGSIEMKSYQSKRTYVHEDSRVIKSVYR